MNDSKMHFLLLGASGRTGQKVLSAALKSGHTVTALVRDTSSFQTHTHSDRVTAVQGSPTSPSDLATTFTSTATPIDAVIITLAVARTSDSPFSPLASPRFLIRDTIQALLPQMRAHGVRKLIVMSAFGSGDSWRSLAWPMKLVFKYTNMSYVLEDHDAVEKELREHGEGLDWWLPKPVMLKDGEEKMVREFGEIGQRVRMLDNVTRESVAGMLVKAAEGNDWRERTVVIAN